jgi:hypothetical protein
MYRNLTRLSISHGNLYYKLSFSDGYLKLGAFASLIIKTFDYCSSKRSRTTVECCPKASAIQVDDHEGGVNEQRKKEHQKRRGKPRAACPE